MNSREKILKTALELFVKQGIEKTSTAQISTASGLSAAGIFVHFKTKNELVEQLYFERKKCSLDEFTQVIDLELDAEKNIRAISEKILEYYAENKLDFNYFFLVQNSPMISENIEKLMLKEYKEQSVIFNNWIESGYLKKIDADLLGKIWWGIMIPIIQRMHKDNTKTVKPEYLDFIWNSLKK
jgi:AcrR family transcriptional regulator